MTFLILLFYFFSTLSFSQTILPEEYRLLSEYMKTKDENLGKYLLEKYPNAVFSEDLKLLLSENAYQRGDPETARNYLKSINADRLKPDLFDKYVQLWKALDLDKKSALLSYPVLFRDFIGSVKLTESQALQVADKLLKSRHYRDVIKVLSDVKDERACYYLGVSYFRIGDESKAEEILSSCKDERSYKYLALIYLKQNREDSLREILLKVRDTNIRDNILLIVGREYLQRKEYEKANEFFSLMTDSYDRFFHLGLIGFIQKEYEKSLQHFIRAYYFARNEAESSKACFWAYRSYAMQGKEDLGLRYLVIAGKGEGFYSAVAKMASGEPLISKGVRRVFSEGDTPVQAEVIKAIRSAGFYYYSRLEAFKRLKELSPTDIIAISRFDPFLSIRLAVRKYGSTSDVYKYVAFPLPYKQYVYRASEVYGIAPELIWAVMRQESLFDPFAVSVSGA
ncbi:MAG: transglycosylase SLT domain-containing protein, partial [Hydrogenobacter sp.]